jgi:hypothetical protein
MRVRLQGSAGRQSQVRDRNDLRRLSPNALSHVRRHKPKRASLKSHRTPDVAEVAPDGLGDERCTAAPAAWAQFSTPHSATLTPQCDPARPPHRHWWSALRAVADRGIGHHSELTGLVRRKKPLAALGDVSGRRSSAGGAIEVGQRVRTGHGPILTPNDRRRRSQIARPICRGGCPQDDALPKRSWRPPRLPTLNWYP